MTNREYYKEQILDIACSGKTIAFIKETNELIACEDHRDCDNCVFYERYMGTNCTNKTQEWANAEYVEPPVDWTKVAVDTKILVKNSPEHSWQRRYFAKYEGGHVYTWDSGKTSWTCYHNDSFSPSDSHITGWKYAKLYKEE